MKRLDIQEGAKFGRLAVIEEVPRSKESRLFLCLCECENKKVVSLKQLRRGDVRSCGCFAIECYRQQGKNNLRHGHTQNKHPTPEYTTWLAIKARCLKPTDKAYKNYGGRGIRICNEWVNDFAAFLAYVGPRPSLDHSIDRIDNDGDYEPGNVKWSTMTEQARNMRRTLFYTANGVTLTASEWSERIGIPRSVMRNRRLLGWPDEQIINTPLRRTKPSGNLV